MSTFILKKRVQSFDTDSFGIVHHSNYLRYMEQARYEWARHLGYALEEAIEKGVLFVVYQAELKYSAPLKTYTEIEVVSTIKKQRDVSLTYEQIVRDAKEVNKIYCTGLITVVCVDKAIRPQRFPDILKLT